MVNGCLVCFFSKLLLALLMLALVLSWIVVQFYFKTGDFRLIKAFLTARILCLVLGHLPIVLFIFTVESHLLLPLLVILLLNCSHELLMVRGHHVLLVTQVWVVNWFFLDVIVGLFKLLNFSIVKLTILYHVLKRDQSSHVRLNQDHLPKWGVSFRESLLSCTDQTCRVMAAL